MGPAIRHATRTLAVSDLFATAISSYATGPVQSLPHGYQPEWVLPEVDEAARLMLRTTGPNLLRGQLARAMSDRYAGRLTPKQQQLCWQLEAGIPADVVYQADGGPARLVIAYPELDGDVLDVWSLGDRAYRRLELARIDLS